MRNFKAIATAGVFALSTSLASSAYADTIGCASFASNSDEVIEQLEDVIAALEQWISERTPADPNYAALTGHLMTAQDNLDRMLNGTAGSKLPAMYSYFACNLDVSPA